MKMVSSILLSILSASQIATANIFNIPNELVCSTADTETVAAEVFELGSKLLIEFTQRDGQLGHLSVHPTPEGFSSKKGEWHNISLTQLDGDKYAFSVFKAKNDGSNGEAIVMPIEVICTAPAQQ